MLQSSEAFRNQVLKNIINDQALKRQVSNAIRRNSGSQEDAEDSFQNGLIVLNKQLEDGKYHGGALKGYFYQICFNIWRNQLKKPKTSSLPDYINSSSEDPHLALEKKESSVELEVIFNQLGTTCQKILELKYFVLNQYSMNEIAKIMNLKNAQNASNALTKCRKRLWVLLNEHNYASLWKMKN